MNGSPLSVADSLLLAVTPEEKRGTRSKTPDFSADVGPWTDEGIDWGPAKGLVGVGGGKAFVADDETVGSGLLAGVMKPFHWNSGWMRPRGPRIGGTP